MCFQSERNYSHVGQHDPYLGFLGLMLICFFRLRLATLRLTSWSPHLIPIQSAEYESSTFNPLISRLIWQNTGQMSRKRSRNLLVFFLKKRNLTATIPLTHGLQQSLKCLLRPQWLQHKRLLSSLHGNLSPLGLIHWNVSVRVSVPKRFPSLIFCLRWSSPVLSHQSLSRTSVNEMTRLEKGSHIEFWHLWLHVV